MPTIRKKRAVGTQTTYRNSRCTSLEAGFHLLTPLSAVAQLTFKASVYSQLPELATPSRFFVQLESPGLTFEAHPPPIIMVTARMTYLLQAAACC